MSAIKAPETNEEIFARKRIAREMVRQKSLTEKIDIALKLYRDTEFFRQRRAKASVSVKNPG